MSSESNVHHDYQCDAFSTMWCYSPMRGNVPCNISFQPLLLEWSYEFWDFYQSSRHSTRKQTVVSQQCSLLHLDNALHLRFPHQYLSLWMQCMQAVIWSPSRIPLKTLQWIRSYLVFQNCIHRSMFSLQSRKPFCLYPPNLLNIWATLLAMANSNSELHSTHGPHDQMILRVSFSSSFSLSFGSCDI